ncbi:MAG TPA: hypothetical protein VIM46_05705 [Luteolibacter sp.]
MYRLLLDGNEIGTTALESGDPPMGIVCGKISFHVAESPYRLILDHCLTHKIIVNGNEPEHEFIDTQIIPSLQVFRKDGLEIAGQGCCVAGFKEEGYEITILGVPYPFYGEEFLHHCEAYDQRFKA